MTDHDPPHEEASPAELRLDEHLELLRASPPTATPELLARIIAGARWQYAIRDHLVMAGAVTGAFADSLRLLLGRLEGPR